MFSFTHFSQKKTPDRSRCFGTMMRCKLTLTQLLIVYEKELFPSIGLEKIIHSFKSMSAFAINLKNHYTTMETTGIVDEEKTTGEARRKT